MKKIMTNGQRDLDYQSLSIEDWKRKWISQDGGFIIPRRSSFGHKRIFREY